MPVLQMPLYPLEERENVGPLPSPRPHEAALGRCLWSVERQSEWVQSQGEASVGAAAEGLCVYVEAARTVGGQRGTEQTTPVTSLPRPLSGASQSCPPWVLSRVPSGVWLCVAALGPGVHLLMGRFCCR